MIHTKEEMPEELKNVFQQNAALEQAFLALSPGKQRGYILHFLQAKQSETRYKRIEKCTPLIMSGKGIQGK
jgi:Uncharacterized protein conserved in bacteria